MRKCWEMGLDGASVPDRTPSEVKGMIAARTAQRKDMDWVAWRQGQYMTFACNAPKKYPKKPFMMQAEENRNRQEMTDKEMLAVLLEMKEKMKNAH